MQGATEFLDESESPGQESNPSLFFQLLFKTSQYFFSDAVYIYRKPSEGHCKVLFISGNRLDYTFAISLLSVNVKFRFEHS